jgi:ribosomal protein S18 acetylase RimI-like enzyme
MTDSDDPDTFTISLEIRIRPCRLEDLPGLEWWGNFTAHREIIQAAFDSQEHGEALLLLADTQGYPIGQVWIRFAPPHRDRTGLLWALRVFPCLQNQGIGGRLLQAAEQTLRNHGFDHAELEVERDNPHARRFYERHGYRIAELTPDEGWILRKTLERP